MKDYKLKCLKHGKKESTWLFEYEGHTATFVLDGLTEAIKDGIMKICVDGHFAAMEAAAQKERAA